MSGERESTFHEHIDGVWIAKFPPKFFQKGMEHIKNHPDEQFYLQITQNRIYLRRKRQYVNGVIPKDRINGRIISWTLVKITSELG